jgi:hypothetical protein
MVQIYYLSVNIKCTSVYAIFKFLRSLSAIYWQQLQENVLSSDIFPSPHLIVPVECCGARTIFFSSLANPKGRISILGRIEYLLGSFVRTAFLLITLLEML